MKVKFQYLFFFLLIFQIIYAYEKQKDGVLFELKKQKDTDAQLLKVQIITENIIRIIASSVSSFSTRKSLVVEKTNWKPVQWSIKEK
ncbi:MAG: alpha-glucosidase domain-containing protein, partial [Candidatus Anstonellales archaeon]